LTQDADTITEAFSVYTTKGRFLNGVLFRLKARFLERVSCWLYMFAQPADMLNFLISIRLKQCLTKN